MGGASREGVGECNGDVGLPLWGAHSETRPIWGDTTNKGKSK